MEAFEELYGKPSFVIDNKRPNIEIYTEPVGLYKFHSRSGSGKSYLCKELKNYRTGNYPVDGYDYYDFKTNRDLGSLIGTGLKLIAIDRYDMYNGELTDQIVQLSKECIVLLDCKIIPYVKSFYRTVGVELENKKIIVIPEVL